ncbi:MAG: hypothetical protein JNL56_02915 [Alphaproteobacteria bacterium]|nr:hypothetical protein [Alphaproteobacteria bacterium]
MAGTLDAKQVSFAIVSTGAVAGSAVDDSKNRFFGHLTKGWNGKIWDADAITWTANAPSTIPAAERDSWDFGFVQIAEATKFQAFYSSRIPSEGAIIVDYFIKPAMTQTILLDGGSKTAPEPWYRDPAGAVLPNGRIQSASGDHPGLAVPLRLENKVCSYVKNYLFHVIMDRRFWTVFAAKPPGGTIQYVGHFAWRVRYEFMLKWQNKAAVVSKNDSVVTVPAKGESGRPAEAAIQAMLDDPKGPRANDVGTKAQMSAETGADPNRRDLPRRFANTPFDFWTQT